MTLADLIHERRKELLGLWRTEVRRLPSAAQLDAPTLTDSMPQVLDDLASVLRQTKSMSLIEAYVSGAPLEHGLDRLEKNFSIGEVISEYAIMQALVFDLADRSKVDIRGLPTHLITTFFARSMTKASEIYVERLAGRTSQNPKDRP